MPSEKYWCSEKMRIYGKLVRIASINLRSCNNYSFCLIVGKSQKEITYNIIGLLGGKERVFLVNSTNGNNDSEVLYIL